MRNSPQDVHKKALGKGGEKRAREYLKGLGYSILEVNYVSKFGEADIICAAGDTLVFVEVKTRLTEIYGSAAEAVDKNKQARYVRIAQSFLQAMRDDNLSVRFDVIEVYSDAINHIKSAFIS